MSGESTTSGTERADPTNADKPSRRASDNATQETSNEGASTVQSPQRGSASPRKTTNPEKPDGTQRLDGIVRGRAYRERAGFSRQHDPDEAGGRKRAARI